MILLIAELERAFSVINARMFSSDLKNPEFIFQPKKKIAVKFSHENNQIIIGSEIVKTNCTGLLGRLLHEMVHIKNFYNGIVDCRSNQYHNREFLKSALEVGLYVIPSQNRGWGNTVVEITRDYKGKIYVPDQLVIDKRKDAFDEVNFDKRVFNSAKTEINKLIRSSRKAVYFLKYECKCPPPHNSIRSGRRPDGDYPLHIECLDCKSYFTCVDVKEGEKVEYQSNGRTA